MKVKKRNKERLSISKRSVQFQAKLAWPPGELFWNYFLIRGGVFLIHRPGEKLRPWRVVQESQFEAQI